MQLLPYALDAAPWRGSLEVGPENKGPMELTKVAGVCHQAMGSCPIDVSLNIRTELPTLREWERSDLHF
jgi:hypothetical protein